MAQNKITLIGAGLAGSLLSLHLTKKKFEVEIYERRPDMRLTDISAGRSINLALSRRGIYALDEVGLKNEIMAMAIPMTGRLMHDPNGELSFQRYGKDDNEAINSVSRGELNMRLMSAAEQRGVNIHFEKRCTGMDFRTNKLTFLDESTGKEESLSPDTVIGTDGSASAIRTDMQQFGRFNFSQAYLDHGYKELSIPAGPGGDFLIEKNALHIWPRGRYMLIALPNLDGSFTCTLFFPFKGEKSFESLQTEKDVVTFFEEEFPDALPLMPTLVEDFFSNPTGTLVTIKCWPWHVEDKACLLGDAAHAIVPFFGQGMNCAFEDCTILNECLEQHKNWEETFAEFERRRKKNTDAIADMALENYYEMRDRVADPDFLLQKKVEFALQNRYPDLFIPKYSMVSFHRIPYSVAQEKGDVQEEILAELCEWIATVDEIDWKRADELIREKLESMD